MQEALRHGPGIRSAVQMWSVEARREERARIAIAELMRFGSEDAHVLLAVAPRFAGRFDSRQSVEPDVFVQVAATSDETRLAALRTADGLLSPIGRRVSEVLGGRLGEGREPFGFLDGVSKRGWSVLDRLEERDEPAHLLHLELEQDVGAFLALSPEEQNALLGITPDGHRQEADLDAHVVAQAPYAAQLLRRGFPFRTELGIEGLAFVAVAADAQALLDAEQRFFGGLTGRAEALSRFVRLRRRASFLVPPRADWLLAPSVPEENDDGNERASRPSTVNYQLGSKTYAYLQRVLQLGAAEGTLGDMKLSPELAPLVAAIHEILAGGHVEVEVVREGNLDIVEELDRRLDEGEREANAINERAGYSVALTV